MNFYECCVCASVCHGGLIMSRSFWINTYWCCYCVCGIGTATHSSWLHRNGFHLLNQNIHEIKLSWVFYLLNPLFQNSWNKHLFCHSSLLCKLFLFSLWFTYLTLDVVFVPHRIAYPVFQMATHSGKNVNLTVSKDSGESVVLEFKLISSKAAKGLYRAITEIHAFYRWPRALTSDLSPPRTSVPLNSLQTLTHINPHICFHSKQASQPPFHSGYGVSGVKEGHSF